MKAEARESYLLGKLSTTPPSHISSLHFVLSDVYKWNFQIHFFDCSISVHKDHCGLLGGGGEFTSWLEGGASQHFLWDFMIYKEIVLLSFQFGCLKFFFSCLISLARASLLCWSEWASWLCSWYQWKIWVCHCWGQWQLWAYRCLWWS